MASDKGVALTRLGARRLRLLSQGCFSADVRQKASLCLLDTLGAVSTGLNSSLATSMRVQALQDARRPESYAFAFGERVGAETAAFVNAVLAHTAARDDMHLGAVSHIGSMVIPAVLAVAERDAWPGERLVRAIIGGYEMGAVLGTSLQASGKVNPHFRASGMVGAFAVAGAIACGESSEEDVTVSALGLAVNTACGINEWTCSGDSEIFIHMGTAARSGIISHALAKAGVAGSEEVLEGRHGLYTALGVGSSGAATFADWLQTSDVGRGITDVKWKPAACCNFTQTSTALSLKIGQQPGFAVEDIQSVTITTTTAAVHYPGCNNSGALNGVGQGKMSIQYGVSVALSQGVLTEKSWDPSLNKGACLLMGKCTLSTSSTFDGFYKQGLQPARIVVVMKHGEVLTEEVADVPWLSPGDAVQRSRRELRQHMSAERADSLVNHCLHLDELRDCRNLMEQ